MGWETEEPDVAASDPIPAARANRIRDKIVHIVADVASLPTDVAEGGIAYVLGNDRVYRWDGAQWRMEGIEVYTSSAARTTNNPTPVHGDFSFLTDTNVLDFHNGTDWETIAGGSASDSLMDYDDSNYEQVTFSPQNLNTASIAIPGTWSTYRLFWWVNFETTPSSPTQDSRMVFAVELDSVQDESLSLSVSDNTGGEFNGIGTNGYRASESTAGTRTITTTHRRILGSDGWLNSGRVMMRAEKLT